MRPLKKHFLLLAAWLLTGCGEDSTLAFGETLVIGILGSFASPEGATGNAEPRNITLTLEDVSATAVAAGTVDLYTEEPVEVVVASRSQILLEADLGDYVDDTLSEVRLTLKATATAKGKYEDEMAFSWVDPVIVHTESFAVKPAQARRINVLVQWRNVVTRNEDVDPPTETISPPTITTELVD